MRSYDHKHPKGRKFSETELAAHRDNWYARLQSSGGPIAAPEHREQDRVTYGRVTALLNPKGVMTYLRQRSGGMILSSRLDCFHEYLEECHDPTFEFLDVDLEGERAVLTEVIGEYVENALRYLFAIDDSGRLFVQPEMKHSNPDGYYKIVESLKEYELKVLSAYDSLIRMGRRKLAV